MNLSVGSDYTAVVTHLCGRTTSAELLRIGDAPPAVLPSAKRRRARAALLPSVAEARLVGAATPAMAMSPSPQRAVAHANMTIATGRVARGARYVVECAAHTVIRLEQFTDDAGVAIESVTHADFAWASATAGAAPPDTTSVCVVQVLDGVAHTRLLCVMEEEPVALRRLPLGVRHDRVREALSALAGPSLSADSRRAPTPLLVLGDLEFRRQVADSARVAGCSILEPVGLIADLEYDPAAVAAAFAGTGPRFVPPEVVAAAKRRTRRRGVLAGLAAAILLLGAGVLDAINLRKEVARVRVARDSHAAQVEDALAAREQANAIAATLAQVEALRRDTPRWTELLAALSNRLPGDARVTSFRTGTDSLYLVLEGSDAASAFDGLRAIWWLSGFQVAAPVERDLDEAARVTERLSAEASISWAELNAWGGGDP